MSAVEIPLFPLHTVLFPGGVLPLRIFEARYLDMVSRCLQSGSGFGVVLIGQGHEVGGALDSVYQTGTLARVVDFDQLEDGLLGITCQGERRLRVVAQRIQPDQLLLGDVEWIAADPVESPLPGHQPLVELLRSLLAQETLGFYRRWLTEEWESAAWIGNRLAELLPLPLAFKQALLEVRDPCKRLDGLLAVIAQPNPDSLVQ